MSNVVPINTRQLVMDRQTGRVRTVSTREPLDTDMIMRLMTINFKLQKLREALNLLRQSGDEVLQPVVHPVTCSTEVGNE